MWEKHDTGPGRCICGGNRVGQGNWHHPAWESASPLKTADWGAQIVEMFASVVVELLVAEHRFGPAKGAPPCVIRVLIGLVELAN